MNQIILGYAGVHEIFQLALAAHELGELERLWCSTMDGPKSWGRALSRVVNVPSAKPLGYQMLPWDRVKEYPWPVVVQRLFKKLLPWRRSEHFHTNGWFDDMMARQLAKSKASLFVGAETCAAASLKACRATGKKSLLEVAGIPDEFLAGEAEKAASKFGMKLQNQRNSTAMSFRKEQEMAYATHILCCSDIQAKILKQKGLPEDKLTVIPLWVDHAYWSIASTMRAVESTGPLKVLYAGAISLRKGVPYLLEATKALGKDVALSLVGALSSEMVSSLPAEARFRPYQSKGELRGLYAEHDVLVMPSLGDSFGFVALEAMSSGLPVIVTDHCGVPVPDPSWRVPAHDSEAIAKRLAHYATNRTRVREDGAKAAAFAGQFTPGSYRNQVRELYRTMLA
ncbi:MAG: glycosyltransferase family 4 protein [Verrucomicrobiaceae bacterium]|nr:glycosyltransferase family 4 protein [Verrucomicrobiaceae bacterium]